MSDATRVLFLDIDGVLNSTRSCIALGGYPHDFGPEHMAMFDQVALGLIRGLCRTAGVKVVVSSSWRVTHHWLTIGQGLDLPTIGQTPRLLGPRGNEIAYWLATHPEVEEWAIVDDDSDMLPEQLPRFVKTNQFDGLTWGCFEKLCELFHVKPYDCAPGRTLDGNPVRLTWDDSSTIEESTTKT